MSARVITALALLTTLAACSGSEPSAEDMVNDASDMAAGVEGASAELSQDMKAAAAEPGDMPCGLAALPDASDAQPMNVEGKTFNTASTPEQVAAFYRAGVQARGGSSTTGGAPGFAEITVSLGDQGECTVFAQAQMTGGSNVQITKQ